MRADYVWDNKLYVQKCRFHLRALFTWQRRWMFNKYYKKKHDDSGSIKCYGRRYRGRRQKGLLEEGMSSLSFSHFDYLFIP